MSINKGNAKARRNYHIKIDNFKPSVFH